MLAIELLVEEILRLQNVVMYLQAQLGEARNMSDARGPNMSRAWLDEMGARLEQIKRAELAAVPSYCERFASPVNAQELIGRMCAAPLVIQCEEGEIIHTDERPECGPDNNPDWASCPCHEEALEV